MNVRINRLANAFRDACTAYNPVRLESLHEALNRITPSQALTHYNNRFWDCCVNVWDRVHDERLFHFQLHVRAQEPKHWCDRIALRVDIQRNAFYKTGIGYVVAVHFWGRDCDGVESAHASLLPMLGGWYRFVQLEERMKENAEGPCRMSIMSEQEYATFEPYQRDTYAEAAGY